MTDAELIKVLVTASRLAQKKMPIFSNETVNTFYWWDEFVVPLFAKFNLKPEDWMLRNMLPDNSENKRYGH